MTTGDRRASGFAPTRWTQVMRARGQSPEARMALGELCESYWTPVFRFICRDVRNEDAARELTQEFFARLLARGGLETVDPTRGRFRSFLLGAVKHFLGDMRDRDRRLKRGAGLIPESLDQHGDTKGGIEVADPATLPADTFFDQHWAFTLMERGLRALEVEFGAAGKQDHFEVLKPWLAGETPELSQADAARRLGMSEGAIKVAVHRLRRRFRELIRAEIAQTMEDEGNVEAELRYLVEVLSRR